MLRLTAPRARRGGFTLIELLVVITILAALAALTVAFFPSAYSSAREAGAAQQVQGWLSIAKQRAQRDGQPRGLRLWIKDTTTMQVGECEYIEQPPDYAVGRAYTLPASDPGPYTALYFDGTIFTAGSGTVAEWEVQPGDFVEVYGIGLMHRVVSVPSDNNLVVATPVPFKINHTWNWKTMTEAEKNVANYRVLRRPRTTGEETLQLPADIVVDLLTNASYGNPLPPLGSTGTGTYLDILFAPSGQVITPGVSTGTINLWVRSVDPANPNDAWQGDPTIVAIFTRTGLVGAYSPDPSGGRVAPYSLVR